MIIGCKNSSKLSFLKIVLNFYISYYQYIISNIIKKRVV